MSRSLDILMEACAGLTHTHRAMFGGHGFFAPNGGMFAGIVTDDEVILKLEHGPARDELIELGGHPWVYEGTGKPTTMAEWIVVPERFYDDVELFQEWTARAHRLAPAKVAKAPRKKPAGAPSPPAAKTRRPAARAKKAPGKARGTRRR